jgi:hypothetical protein
VNKEMSYTSAPSTGNGSATPSSAAAAAGGSGATGTAGQRGKAGSDSELLGVRTTGSGNWQAFMNLVKPFVGAGILALPRAFSEGGIVVSLPLIPLPLPLPLPLPTITTVIPLDWGGISPNGLNRLCYGAWM